MNTPSHPSEPLRRLVDPKCIVVVGASPRAGSFGERVLHNLESFEGAVYAVNPKYDAVGAVRCHASLADLPEVPDCAVLVGNRDTVEGSLRDCAALGVGGAIVYASGFAETGMPERVEQQVRLVALARETGIRVAGPNCMGIVNCNSGARMTFQSVIPPRPTMSRSIGLVSQSGALGLGLAQASERGVSFSHVLTCGNSCDVTIADFVGYLANDPTCAVIACCFEGMVDPLQLLQAAAHAWAADKPLIVYKMATGELGRAAAVSHTGSLAGAHATYRATLEQVGAIVVDDFNALIETAAFFCKVDQPGGIGAAVLATSGGAAIVAADEAERLGVPMPQPAPATTAVLAQHVPDFGSVANPCDVTAQVLNNAAALDACAGALLADAQYSAMVVPHTLSYEFGLARIDTFQQLAERYGKPVCNVWMSEWLGGPGMVETERCSKVALFRSMGTCFAALKSWHMRAARRQALALQPNDVPAFDEARRQRGRELLTQARSGNLSERESKRVLDLYRIPVTREKLAANAAAACEIAVHIGFPVVVKAESADLPHKSEAGVIRLNLRSAAEVVEACDSIVASAAANAPGARLDGFLVQEMVGRGVEVVVGGRIDPLFGPLIVIGLGGVFVELLNDTALARAPIGPRDARALLLSLRHAQVFDGFRGGPKLDLSALAEVVCRVSLFLAEQQDVVAELDVNPLICDGSRITAVDALIVLKESPPTTKPVHGKPS